MKINLIVVAGESDPLRKVNPFMPLSLPILAGCAPEHDYVFTDLLWEGYDSIDYNADYDLVGISFRVSATKKAFEIADKFRANNKTVILGGAQASSIPIKAKQHADAVVIGEGEPLWPVVLKDYQNNELKDFYICSPIVNSNFDDYKIYRTDGLPELSKLPLPVRNLYKGKYTFDMVDAARGCPVDCSFCSVSNIFGKKMRYKNQDNVLDEISSFGRHFFLVDDTAFGRKDSYDYYLELYKKLQKLPKKRFWIAQANLDAAANNMGRQVIKEASLSGLSYVSIGLESINPDNMRETGITSKLGITESGDTLEELKNNIEFIQDQGIAISGWFTIGLEHDTFESCIQSLEFCEKTNIFPVLNPIQALEGTRYYDELKKEEKLIDQATNVSNVINNSITNKMFIDLMQIAYDRSYTYNKILKKTIFYYKKIKAQKRGSFNLIHRTILIFMTQVKLKKVLRQEIFRFSLRIKDEV